MFVNRVLYGGQDQQRLALGSLAAATAIGALVSGFAVRVLSLRMVTFVGLALSTAGLWQMSLWSPATRIEEIALNLAVFGLGFGLTVTPRSVAAVESVAREFAGVASATVTVARMIGMAIGLSVLVAYGSTAIDRLTAKVYATPDAYRLFIDPSLRDRSIKDGLVVAALENWAAGEAARIMVVLFLVAGAFTIVAAAPALALRSRSLGGGGVPRARPTRQNGSVADPTTTNPRPKRPARDHSPAAGSAAPAGGGSCARPCASAIDWARARPRLAGREPDRDRRRAVSAWRNGTTGQCANGSGFGDLGTAMRDATTTLWVDLTNPSSEQVTEIARLLGLHQLIAEDILEGNQRAKIEVTDELCHVVMFALNYEREMTRSEIDFVLGRNILLTVHEAGWEPRATSHLRDGLAPIMRRGPDHLLWALVDALVDSYFPFIDRMGDEVDQIEDEVVTNADSRVLARLFELKRDLLTARRSAAPVREIFNQLTNRDLALIDREEIVYFRDVYDHLIRLTDELDNYRELVSSALDVYLSTVNNNLSLIMKRLTGITVILAGIGAIAGIFGMSEAGTAFAGLEAAGFWVVAALTVLLAVGLYGFLRRIGWV